MAKVLFSLLQNQNIYTRKNKISAWTNFLDKAKRIFDLILPSKTTP